MSYNSNKVDLGQAKLWVIGGLVFLAALASFAIFQIFGADSDIDTVAVENEPKLITSTRVEVTQGSPLTRATSESTSSTTAPNPEEQQSPAAISEAPTLEPKTFRPPFEDSVVYDTSTICDTAAPSDAIYVAKNGSDNNAGTATSPFATIAKGLETAAPGQTVLVRQGDYNQVARFRGVNGTAEGYITLRAYPGEKVKLIADIGYDAVSFRQGNSYINVACFELAGPTQRPETVPPSPDHNRNRTLAGEDAVANPNNYGNGVSIGDRGDTKAGFTNHHIRIINNDIHDFTAGGITVIESNHVSAIGNRTYRNSKYSCYSTSGISFGYLLDVGGPDNADGYSNYIVGNTSFQNENLSLQCFTDTLGAVITDGNGIIIDENDTQGDAFTARTLVADNITFGNGGRGIMLFDSSRVDVINNASYNNLFTEKLLGRDGPHPEIAVARSEDVKVYNNISVPRGSNQAYTGEGSNADLDSNIFGSPGDGDRLFESAAIDGSGDFALKSSAVDAIDAGTPFLVTPNQSGQTQTSDSVSIGPLFNRG